MGFEFTNREISMFVLLGICFIGFMLFKDTRRIMVEAIKIALCKNFIIWYFFIGIHLLISIFVLETVHLWNIKFTNTVIVWFIFENIYSCFHCLDHRKDDHFFKQQIKSQIGISVLLLYIVDINSFSLFREIIQTLAISVLTLMICVAEAMDNKNKEKGYDKAKNLLLIILGYIWLDKIINSIAFIVNNANSINVVENITRMAIPVILSILFILFNYFFTLCIEYSDIYTRIKKLPKIYPQVKKYLLLRIFKVCKMNLKEVLTFEKKSFLWSHIFEDKEQVDIFIDRYISECK